MLGGIFFFSLSFHHLPFRGLNLHYEQQPPPVVRHRADSLCVIKQAYFPLNLLRAVITTKVYV